MDSCGDACIPVRYDAASGNYVTDEGSQGNGLEDDEDSTTLVDDYTFLLGFANLTNFNNETQYTIFAPTNVAVIDAMNTTYRNFIEIAFNGEKNVTGADCSRRIVSG
ncbi:FAS1 domain-containing protein [Pycnococcus provasolii]